jgi:hypothetical protein
MWPRHISLALSWPRVHRVPLWCVCSIQHSLFILKFFLVASCPMCLTPASTPSLSRPSQQVHRRSECSPMCTWFCTLAGQEPCHIGWDCVQVTGHRSASGYPWALWVPTLYPWLAVDSLLWLQGNTHGTMFPFLCPHNLLGLVLIPLNSLVSIIISMKNCFIIYYTSEFSFQTFCMRSSFHVFDSIFPRHKIRPSWLIYWGACWLLVPSLPQGKGGVQQEYRGGDVS